MKHSSSDTINRVTHRRHTFPFGPQPLDDGGFEFRLWAPEATSVKLMMSATGKKIPMQRNEDGFFTVESKEFHYKDTYQFFIDDSIVVSDPASRYQPEDVYGPSELWNSLAFAWENLDWKGRPWEEVILYELHIGAFSKEGTFQGAKAHLEKLLDLGITAIEVMPLADFPGKRNWGYDGVLPFAPDHTYGTPDDLKDFIQTAHSLGIMVFLDVVYNHFGPEGNYLHSYAEHFFTQKHHTPWGAAINFDDDRSEVVRSFFINNALYWLEEFQFDGLRFDAIHAILDDSEPNFLTELATAIKNGPGKERHIHLIVENEYNQSCNIQRDQNDVPVTFTAQWNDDVRHVLHVMSTGNTEGHLQDYAEDSANKLGKSLTQGFIYQGEPSGFRGNKPRGQSSKGVPLTAFISFNENHDQVGNRPLGDRMSETIPKDRLRLAVAIVLLSPQIPMLFMGEEWAAKEPFPFFCDFQDELTKVITKGRAKEFSHFPGFADPKKRKLIPNPSKASTFESSHLNWADLEEGEHAEWYAHYKKLIAIRKSEVIPYLPTPYSRTTSEYVVLNENALMVKWTWNEKHQLCLLANLGKNTVPCEIPNGQLVYETSENVLSQAVDGKLAPVSALWVQREV